MLKLSDGTKAPISLVTFADSRLAICQRRTILEAEGTGIFDNIFAYHEYSLPDQKEFYETLKTYSG